MSHFLKFFFFFFFSFFSLHISAEVISIATGEYAPFTAEKAKHSGFVNRVIKEAFSRKQIEVEFIYMPWKRALEDTRSGKMDASSFWFENEERKIDFIFSEALSEHRQLIFHQKSTKVPDWSAIEDLKGLTFGATRGYTYTPEFWAASENGLLNVSVVTSDSQNFKKLIKNRIELFIMDEITGWQLLRNELPLAIDKITTHNKAVTNSHGYLLFPKTLPNSDHLATRFNEGLTEIKADGTYEQFLEELYQNIF